MWTEHSIKTFVFIIRFLFALFMFLKGLIENDEIRCYGGAAILTAFIIAPILFN